MKKTFAKTIAATGIVGFVALAPAPAFAYAPTETPDSITVSINTPITIVFAPIFAVGSDVDVTLTGINGNTQSLASVGAVSSTSVVKTAAADGSATVEVTFNSDAAGSYELLASGVDEDGNPVSDTVTITIAGTDGTGTGTGAEGAGTGTDAANTGVNGAGTDTSGTDASATDASATGADAASSGEELAATGPGSIGILVGGAALLLVGGAVLVARSMRNSKSHA